jgi:hypothetical protein
VIEDILIYIATAAVIFHIIRNESPSPDDHSKEEWA